MNIRIFYFSGTGNTAWVARCLCSKLKSLGNQVECESCEEVNLATMDLERTDMIGILFPIHSSFVPKIFEEFLLKLPNTINKPLFAISTAGYAAGDVAYYTTEKLKIKGYEPFLFANIIMGNNLHLPTLCPLPVTSPLKMEKRLKKAEHKITKLSYLINCKKIHKEGTGVVGRLFGITQRTIAEKFENKAFKGFYVDANCTKCGFCMSSCPINNITIKDNKVTFLGNCMLCMRCYNFCPRRAIQCTEKTKDIEKYHRYQGPEGKGTYK